MHEAMRLQGGGTLGDTQALGKREFLKSYSTPELILLCPTSARLISPRADGSDLETLLVSIISNYDIWGINLHPGSSEKRRISYLEKMIQAHCVLRARHCSEGYI